MPISRLQISSVTLLCFFYPAQVWLLYRKTTFLQTLTNSLSLPRIYISLHLFLLYWNCVIFAFLLSNLLSVFLNHAFPFLYCFLSGFTWRFYHFSSTLIKGLILKNERLSQLSLSNEITLFKLSLSRSEFLLILVIRIKFFLANSRAFYYLCWLSRM